MKKRALLLSLTPLLLLSACGPATQNSSSAASTASTSVYSEAESYDFPSDSANGEISVEQPPEESAPSFVLSYHTDRSGYLIDDYIGTMSKFTIPSFASGDQGKAPIVGISANAFFKRDFIREIALPDSIQYIGEYAFDQTGLETLYVTPSLTDCTPASFAGSNLGVRAFGNAYFLSSLTFKYAYAIGPSDSNAEAVVLPEGCFGIMNNAFKGYKGKISVPSSIKVFGDWGDETSRKNAYFAKELTSVTYAAASSLSSLGVAPRTIRFAEGATIKEWAISNLPRLERVFLPESQFEKEVEFMGSSCLRAIFYQVTEKSAQGYGSGNGHSMAFVPANYEPKFAGDFEYVQDQNGVALLAYRGEEKDVTLPKQIELNDSTKCNYKVMSGVFSGYDIDSVRLESEQNATSSSSFYRCGAKKIVFGPDYQYKKNDFYAQWLGNGYYLFNDLEAFEVDAKNESLMAKDGILYTKDGKWLLRCPRNSSLTGYKIGNDVTIVGTYAFLGCKNTKHIEFGDSVKTIESEAFYDDGFSAAHRDSYSGLSLTFTGTLNAFLEQPYWYGFHAPLYLSFNGSPTTKITVPSSLTWLSYGTFRNCVGITSVTLPSSIGTLRGSTFENCWSLSSVSLPAGLKNIENGDFRNCVSLNKLVVPAGCYVDQRAFDGCNGLIVYFRDAEPKFTYSTSGGIPGVTFVGGYNGN